MGFGINHQLCCQMKKEQGQDTSKELVKYLLPAGTLEYFELTHIEMQKAGWQAILDNFKAYTEAN